MMTDRDELKQEMEQELQWVKYRQKMLDLIEDKLMQMKQLAEQAEEDNLRPTELEVLNNKLNNLAEQVRALDSESRKIQDGKILE